MNFFKILFTIPLTPTDLKLLNLGNHKTLSLNLSLSWTIVFLIYFFLIFQSFFKVFS